MVSIINSVLSYLLLMFVCVVVAGAGFCVGLVLRKRKKNSNDKKAQESVEQVNE